MVKKFNPKEIYKADKAIAFELALGYNVVKEGLTMNISEGDKVKLHSGDTAWISEILGDDVYIVEVLKKEGGVSIEQIERYDIVAKIVEVEQPLTA